MRSYDLAELEALSTLSRRTISDYVSKGLLSGPSHRGRGARYSQRDLDALNIIPMLRTVLKLEFPNLNSVREFLSDLSPADLRHLARLKHNNIAVKGSSACGRGLIAISNFFSLVSFFTNDHAGHRNSTNAA